MLAYGYSRDNIQVQDTTFKQIISTQIDLRILSSVKQTYKRRSQEIQMVFVNKKF